MTDQSPNTNSQQSSSNISSSTSNHILTYDPQQFWTEQGKTYKEQFQYNEKFELQEQMLIDYLKKNVSLSSFSTILEVGCGFGRITKLLLLNFPNIRELTVLWELLVAQQYHHLPLIPLPLPLCHIKIAVIMNTMKDF